MLYSFKNQTGTVSAFYGVINNRQDVQSSFARVFVCKKNNRFQRNYFRWASVL